MPEKRLFSRWQKFGVRARLFRARQSRHRVQCDTVMERLYLSVAKRLELASGKEVQLHYYEYVGTLPWRGVSKFIVDSIVSISGPKPSLGQ